MSAQPSSHSLDWSYAYTHRLAKLTHDNSGRLRQLETIAIRLADEIDRGILPCLNLPFKAHLESELPKFTERLKAFKHMLVLGIGGSALGARALQKAFFPAQDRPGHTGPWLWIADNIDADTLGAWMNSLPPKETAAGTTVVVLATPAPAPVATSSLATAKKAVPPVAPAPATPTNGAPAVRPAVAKHSPQYQRAARFYNYALDTYRQYTGRMSIPLVQHIETACRQAVSDFNACPEAQTEKAAVDQLVQRCYQLLADARLSSKVANAPGVTTATLPPLPSMELPAEPTPEPTTTAVKTSAPAPVAVPAIQPRPVDEAALAAAWKTKPATHTAVMEEFRDLFSLYAPDPDAGMQNLLLYDRIAYGMNAAEAARLLGTKADAMKPLQSPLFPSGHYFLHDVALPPTTGFERLLLVVDRADRVVAVQLLIEKPTGTELQLPASLFQSRWKCYDFIRVTTKPSTEWRIAYRVALVGRLARLDSELAANNDAAPLGLGAPRVRSYLYFPQALAARMLERVDTP